MSLIRKSAFLDTIFSASFTSDFRQLRAQKNSNNLLIIRNYTNANKNATSKLIGLQHEA